MKAKSHQKRQKKITTKHVVAFFFHMAIAFPLCFVEAAFQPPTSLTPWSFASSCYQSMGGDIKSRNSKKSPLYSNMKQEEKDDFELSSGGEDKKETIKITTPSLSTPSNLPATDSSEQSPLHSLYIQPSFFTPTQTSKILSLAKQHAERTNCWTTKDDERHSTYATVDFPIEESVELSEYLADIGFQDKMFGEMAELFGLDSSDLSFLDFFCVQYQAKEDDDDGNDDVMDQLEPHRDGSLLSFTILLTPPNEFEGGGTSFDALRDVTLPDHNVLHQGGVIRPQNAGDAVLHSGKLLHGADVVTFGHRVVLVGFVDVGLWCTRNEFLPIATKEWGRCDVMSYRYKRQSAMMTQKKQSGWILNNSRWLPPPSEARGRSYIKGYVPAFSSVIKRADKEFQRMKKLQVEYWLLQNILLPEEERGGADDYEDDTLNEDEQREREEVLRQLGIDINDITIL
mmetsp:Transcript_60694/g.90057  ORF Transcript_60694/g.90057 Transcript_60694/m.90057 type:complete len:455 (+) Transcript_60694:65-1429(+)